MATIDVGPGAIDRSSSFNYGYTIIDQANPANDTGILTSFDIWGTTNISSVKMGTFYGSSTSYTCRDYETLGTVVGGSKQSYTGLDCSVTSGDFIGSYNATGILECHPSGYTGVYFKTGDQFSAGAQTYSNASGRAISLYATGATVEAGHPTMKRWGGVPFMALNKGVF